MFPNHPQRVLSGDQSELDESQVADNQGGVSQEGEIADQTAEDSDVEFQAKLEALREEMAAKEKAHERNVAKLQSSLDRQIQETQRQAEQEKREWENRYHQEKMQGLDEVGQIQYQNEVLVNRLQQAEQAVYEAQEREINAKNKSSYLATFLEMGIDPQKINMGGTVQEMIDSGWQALNEERIEMQALIEELKAGRTPGQQAEPKPAQNLDIEPPRVATDVHGPSGPQGPRTMKDAIDEAENLIGWRPTASQLFEMVNQGQLKPEILPGLEGGVPSAE